MDHFIIINVRKVPKKSVLDKLFIRIGVVNYLLRLGRAELAVGSFQRKNLFVFINWFALG